MREIYAVCQVSGRGHENAGNSRELRVTWQVCFHIKVLTTSGQLQLLINMHFDS